jgi:hypothetical protein
MSPIVQFLTADGRDHAGRGVEDVLAFDDRELEARHDFIQWLFPLPEPSRAVAGAPVLTPADVVLLRRSPEAQARLTQAAARMLAFYRANDDWRVRFDHNHLRISRIIKSLRLLTGDQAADTFRAEILHLAQGAPIDPQARRHWAGA